MEEEQEFKEFAAQPGAMDRIFARIAPQVRICCLVCASWEGPSRSAWV
jgi:hypothetical protein